MGGLRGNSFSEALTVGRAAHVWKRSSQSLSPFRIGFILLMFILSANMNVLFVYVQRLLSFEFAAVNSYLTCRNFSRTNRLSNQICVHQHTHKQTGDVLSNKKRIVLQS